MRSRMKTHRGLRARDIWGICTFGGSYQRLADASTSVFMLRDFEVPDTRRKHSFFSSEFLEKSRDTAVSCRSVHFRFQLRSNIALSVRPF
jgi:hypothetical protein